MATDFRRLEHEGLIDESGKRPSPESDDERRRYYRLTPAGRVTRARKVRHGP